MKRKRKRRKSRRGHLACMHAQFSALHSFFGPCTCRGLLRMMHPIRIFFSVTQYFSTLFCFPFSLPLFCARDASSLAQCTSVSYGQLVYPYFSACGLAFWVLLLLMAVQTV